MTDRITTLMRRYVRLGGLLADDIDTDDAAEVAEAKIILAEMAVVQSQIEALVQRHRPN